MNFSTPYPPYPPEGGDKGIGPLGPDFQNPFSFRRLARIFRGTPIQISPAAFGLLRGPLTGAIRLIRVPRNFTLLERTLVMRVFSSDSVSLSELRKRATSDFRLTARDLGPQTPINQSSA
jgi:hypothetical protein